MLNPVMCETADDVLRVAREVREWRQKSLLPVKNPKPKRGQLKFKERHYEPVVCDRNLAIVDLWIMSSRLTSEPEPASVERVSIRDIQKAVCMAFHVNLVDMLSCRRGFNITTPRHVAMLLCRGLTGKTLHIVANSFHRDHTTVMHACQKYAWLLDKLRAEIDVSTQLSTWADRAAQLVKEQQERKALGAKTE